MTKDKHVQGEDTSHLLETHVNQTNELKNSLALVRATLESTMDGILIVNKDNHIIDFNAKFVLMWNIPEDVMKSGDEMQALQFVLNQVVDPDGLFKQVTKLYDNIEEKGNLGEINFKDGRVFERYSQPHRVGNQIVGRVWSFRDITERKHSEEALRLRNQAIESSAHGILITSSENTDCAIIYANPAFERITGYKKEEIIGKNCRFLQGAERHQPSLQRLRLALKEKREESIVVQNFRKDGTLFWNQLNIAPVFDLTGEVKHFVGIIMDITNQKKMEEQLIHQATHDLLTGLPNRSLLIDRIQQAIIQVKRTHLIVAILFFDIDQFKVVNDSLGHVIGDLLLQQISERLLNCVREVDTVVRMGGDEFVIVLPGIENEEVAYEQANKILHDLVKPLKIDNRELQVTASIGISFYPKDGESIDILLSNADISMYHAKEKGRNNFQTYTAELNKKITYRMNMENYLRSAIERREFILNYQPLIDLKTNSIFGAEALLRWMHPVLGLVSPQDFIPIAEEDGLVIPIGAWVLDAACQQLKQWHSAGFSKLRMAVNLSSRQLQTPDIIENIRGIIAGAKVNPKYIELEITEGTLLDNSEEMIDKLNQLRATGCSVVIDDFGTGYSSLSYLKRFPVETLKIDRSFVMDMMSNDNNAAIVQAIITLAHSLHLKVLAEGIETKEQLNFLIQHECDSGQGYYFSKPIDAKAFTLLLENYNVLVSTE